jgi:ABC-type nitrate/sulfonate/bicarbonate transport system substrate-binding protein
MDHLSFPYRSSSHLALMHVIAESGAWERQGLRVDYDKKISREDAHRLVSTGEVEFTSGNHVSTYAARARGDTWVYLGQSVSNNRLALVTRPDSGIDSLADIRGRKFATKGRHPQLNDWLYLKQHGFDIDRDDVEFLKFGSATTDPELAKIGKVEAVQKGLADLCFVSQPRRELAERLGLKAIDIEPQPMIYFATVSTSLPFAREHPDQIAKMLKGMLEGIAFFKTQREKTIRILMDKHTKEGKLDRDAATKLYDELAPNLEPKLYPTLQAVYNVYEEAKRQSKDAERIHPLALWDFHFLREIDDSGFIDRLYKADALVVANQ